MECIYFVDTDLIDPWENEMTNLKFHFSAQR